VPADFLNDHGFAAWVGVKPESNLSLQVGYGRSFPYNYDSVFFGLGFGFGSLRRRSKLHKLKKATKPRLFSFAERASTAPAGR